jgi:hypothetical protein
MEDEVAFVVEFGQQAPAAFPHKHYWQEFRLAREKAPEFGI